MAHPDALAEATEDARRRCQDGDFAGARAVLRDALAGVPAHDRDPDVAMASRLYAAVLVALGETHNARSSAARAYETCRDVLGPGHPETMAAAATLASVLRTTGSHAQAAQLYGYLTGALSTMEGERSRATLAARADLATECHAQGECSRARRMLAETYEMHRDEYGEGDPATIKMAARLGQFARDCGDFPTAQEHFDQARLLSQYHLGPDDPLTVAVTALGQAPAESHLLCERGRPAGPPAVRRPVEWPPDEASPPPPAAGPATQRSPAPSIPAQRSPAQQPPAPPLSAAQSPFPARPQSPAPTSSPASSYPTAPPASLYPAGSSPGSLYPAEPAPSSLTPGQPQLTRPAPVAAPGPSSGGHRPRRRRRTTSRALILLGLALLLAGAGAGAVALARTGDPQSTDTPRAAATTAPAASPTAGPEAPRDVRLTDRGTSVELTWRLPAGAEGPLFVSGSSGNNPPRPFQTLLPGSTTYTVHGLNPSLEYCFVLTLVYSTEVTAGSDPVCTKRGA